MLKAIEDLHNNGEQRCGGMYYFDSQGAPPPNNILNLMEKLCKQGDNCNIKFQKLYNDIQYQKGNTECGIYSIHFIITMLNGTSFTEYKNKSELNSAFSLAKREALSAFGNSTVYVEKFLSNPRHIEVQVLADHHGNIIHVDYSHLQELLMVLLEALQQYPTILA